MTINDVITLRVDDDTWKVEIVAQANTTDTLPNYGTVQLEEGEYNWAIASGESGVGKTLGAAVADAAKAIREHWKRTREASTQVPQKVIALVPAALVEAVNKLVDRYGADQVKAFYSVEGYVLVEYHDGKTPGVGIVRFAVAHNGDTSVVATHLTPRYFEGGLPDRFNSSVMYDTTEEWWSKPEACPACNNELGNYAISRFDGRTKICSDCGMAEAMGDLAGVKLLGPGQVDG